MIKNFKTCTPSPSPTIPSRFSTSYKLKNEIAITLTVVAYTPMGL